MPVSALKTRSPVTLFVIKSPNFFIPDSFFRSRYFSLYRTETADDQEKWVLLLIVCLQKILPLRFLITGNRPNYIAGMGELYLEVIVDRLKREFGVNVKPVLLK